MTTERAGGEAGDGDVIDSRTKPSERDPQEVEKVASSEQVSAPTGGTSTTPGRLIDEVWEADPPGTLSGIGPDAEHTRRELLHGILKPGTTFGVYVVGECIGEGGMARIYRAEHTGLRRRVALKVLINGFARDPDGRGRFVREARIAAAIKHPNVVNIFDVGVHQEVPYLVMELLEGIDLEALLAQKKRLDESTLIDIMVPVVAGLTAVHDAGIVHRDLKPGNIFLARGRYGDFEPKLLDFGISKSAENEQHKLTSAGEMMGTPFYVSPEALSGQGITPRSDQYSLGVVMYECVTGEAPFSAPTLPELARLITLGAHTPSQTQNPQLSKRLAAIIGRAMAVDPAKRYHDMREMGRELLTLAGQRTRITWGLSFGETLKNVQAQSESFDSPALARTEAPNRHAKRARNVGLALLSLMVLLLIPLALRGSLAGERSDAPVRGSNLTTAMSPLVVAPPATQAVPLPEVVPQPQGSSQAAAASSSEPRVRPSRDSNVRSRHAAGRPASASVDTETISVRQRPQPPSRPGNSSRSGSNGAPIFD